MNPVVSAFLFVGSLIGVAILAIFLNQVIAVLSPQGFLLVGGIAAVILWLTARSP